MWHYERLEKWEERPASSYENAAKSSQSLKKQRFPHQKRFASNTLRYSQKMHNAPYHNS